MDVKGQVGRHGVMGAAQRGKAEVERCTVALQVRSAVNVMTVQQVTIWQSARRNEKASATCLA